MDKYECKFRRGEKALPRQFDHHTTWEDVENMTIEEAIIVLSRFANTDGKDWSARPHLAKACQMAISALEQTK